MRQMLSSTKDRSMINMLCCCMLCLSAVFLPPIFKARPMNRQIRNTERVSGKRSLSINEMVGATRTVAGFSRQRGEVPQQGG